MRFKRQGDMRRKWMHRFGDGVMSYRTYRFKKQACELIAWILTWGFVFFALSFIVGFGLRAGAEIAGKVF
jgi:hypothetical protein